MTSTPPPGHNGSALALLDVPTAEDALGVAPYVDALTSFITGCPTPMTIAIQGDWGSGKTSVMAMVQQRLQGGSGLVVTFNTWQYSQFDLGNDLVLNLIQSIVDQLDPESGEEASKVRQCLAVLKFAGRAAADTALSTGAFLVGGLIGQAAYEGAKKGFLGRNRSGQEEEAPAPIDVVAALVDLRAGFEKVVANRVAAAGRDRVVIFIDDLDRLPPKRSVEVMEGLKSLLDCAGCVFVLAIDFSVVSQGVRDKYGHTMDEAKARAFFDKIIQLPFQMPTAQFSVSEMLKSSLNTLGIQVDAPKGLATYEALIRLSVGTNPRALKRLLNSFSLLRRIPAQQSPPEESEADSASGSSGTSSRNTDLQLFALLALQSGYPAFHDAIISTEPERVDALLAQALSLAQDLNETAVEALGPWGVSSSDAPKFAEFLRVMIATLPTGSAGSEQLAQRITLTAVTAVRGPQRSVGRLDRATVMDPDERAARLLAQGVSEAAIAQAIALETEMRRHLAAQGLPFSAAEQAKGNVWSWYASAADFQGSRRGTFCEVYFTSSGSLNLYFCPASWPEAVIKDLSSIAQRVAEENEWEFKIGKSGNILRLYKITNGDPIDPLLPLLAKCYAQARL